MYGAGSCYWRWCALAAPLHPAAPSKTHCRGRFWCACAASAACGPRRGPTGWSCNQTPWPRPTALLYWCHHCRALPPGVDVVKLFCACVFAQQPAWTTASAAGPGNRRPAPCHPCVATRHYDRHPVQLQQLRQPHQWRGDPGGTAATDGVVVQGPCYRQSYVSYVVNVCRCPSGPPPASRLRYRRYQPQHHLYRRLCQ